MYHTLFVVIDGVVSTRDSHKQFEKKLNMSLSAKLELIEQTTGYVFQDRKIFEDCITKSDEIHGNRINFQRMEFLGDRVLNLSVSHLLYIYLPKESEGRLTQIAEEFLRNGPTMAAIAKKWKLDKVLHINISDRINGLLDNHKRLSDAVEALLGGIWLDCNQNFSLMCQFVKKHWNITTESLKQHKTDSLLKSFHNPFEEVEEEELLSRTTKQVTSRSSVVQKWLKKPKTKLESESDEEESESDEEIIPKFTESYHLGKLKIISCSNQYICKIEDCSNRNPCKLQYYQYTCCNLVSTNLSILDTTPCKVRNSNMETFICRHCKETIVQGQSMLCSKYYHSGFLEEKTCSNQYKCKLYGCSNKKPCKEERYRYTCCGQFVDFPHKQTKGCKQRQHERTISDLLKSRSFMSNIREYPSDDL